MLLPFYRIFCYLVRIFRPTYLPFFEHSMLGSVINLVHQNISNIDFILIFLIHLPHLWSNFLYFLYIVVCFIILLFYQHIFRLLYHFFFFLLIFVYDYLYHFRQYLNHYNNIRCDNNCYNYNYFFSVCNFFSYIGLDFPRFCFRFQSLIHLLLSLYYRISNSLLIIQSM